MGITIRKKRVVDETNQSPSELILPGTWFGSETPAVTTNNKETYQQAQWTWLDKKYDLWETSLSASPDTWILWKITQTYNNIFWELNSRNEARKKSLQESATNARNKAYSAWQDIYKWDYLKWAGKIASATVSWVASPFTSVLNKEVLGEWWKTSGKVLGLPFTVLHQDFANWLALWWMDKEDASNIAEWLAFIASFWVWKPFENIKVSSKWLWPTVDIASKITDAMPTISEARIKYPDIAKDFWVWLKKANATIWTNKYTKEAVSQLNDIQVKYTDSFLRWDKIWMDYYLEQANKIRKQEDSRIIKEWLSGKRASIEFKFKNEAEKQAYDAIKKDIQDSITYWKQAPDIWKLIDDWAFNMFANDPIKQSQVKDKLNKDIYWEVWVEVPKQDIITDNKVWPKDKNQAYKLFSELEAIQVAKDKQGKFDNTAVKQDLLDLWMNPDDFKDTENNQRKTEITNELTDLWYMKWTKFTDKTFENFNNFKESFPNLWIWVHKAKIEPKTPINPIERIMKENKGTQVRIRRQTPIKNAEETSKIKDKFWLKCVWSNCWVNAINSYVKSWEKGSIRQWVFVDWNHPYEQDVQLAKSLIEKNKWRPLHTWHRMWKEVVWDTIVWKKKGRYVTLEEVQKAKTETPIKKESKLPTFQKRVETKKFEKFAKELAKIEKDPTQTDVARLLNKMQGTQIKDVTKYALGKNMITKEFADFANKTVTNTLKSTPQAPTGRINDTQKMHILDMLGYNTIFKPIDELKINIPELSKSLKDIQARLHIVNTPEWSRVKLPFSLMGNKSATYRQVLLPMVKKAIKQGAKTYVEPFGGAGTVYYFADEMIKSGIEQMHINHFDNEKYQVIKAIKDKKVWNIVWLVDSAYDHIIWEMWAELAHIPEIADIMEEYWVEVWSKEFKDIAELSFYPQYAKQFFQERPDTKLWMKWEVSSSFKEWLREHLRQESEKAGLELTWEKLDTAVETVLNDQSVFENKYPEISKKISNVLDKYDNINIKDWDVDSAMLVSMSRHFRQRWDSGQKVVSASWGFQNVVNVRNKMIDWLTKYQQVFNKHWDKIKIYNQDGKKFIADMGKTNNNLETIIYSDPPYVRTTGVYIKNQPAEIKWALEEYADTSKIHQLFDPMKDSIMMFTNDINWPYFEALDWMLDGRMSKDIIWYREWTTPTSLVTTNEIAVKPKDVGLSYYQPLKDRFTKDMSNALRDSLFPKIATQQKKILAKFEQHFMDLMQKKFWDITKIQDQQFKWKQAFEDLQASLETVVSWKDKQKIISEAKKWLKQNIVTGKDVSNMIDKINKLWVNRQALAKNVRTEVEKLRGISTIDVESKQAFFDWFNKEYTIKKTPESRSKEVEAVDKIMKWEDFTPSELEIFEKYLKDEKFYNKIEDARKQSIYQLDIDSLNTLLDTVKYYEKVGKEYRAHKDLELNQKVEAERVKAEPQLKKIESTKPLSIKETISKDNRLKEIGIKAKVKTQEALIDATPIEWVLDEELNLSRTSYNFIEKPINKHRDYIEDVAIKFDELSKELKITNEGWKKITLHWLARRSDWKGKIKIIARMKKGWEDPATFSDKLQEFSSDTFLNEWEKKMYNYMQSVFKELGKEMQKTKILLDNEMVTLMDEYFPIQMDWASNQDKFADTIDPNTIDNGSDLFRKTKTEQGFTKEATGLEVVPELMSDKIFKTHVSNVSYYTNMQKPIKQLNQLVNEWGKDKLWDLGYKFMKNYLDVLSRQWILWVQSWFDRAVSAWVRNFQSAVLWYNPTTMALQTSAIFEWLSVWWNVDLWAYKDIVKAVTGKKEVWDMVTEKSGVVRNREYRNLFWNTTDKFDKWIMEKWNKYWFYGIQKADAVLSRILWYSEYKRNLKQGKNETDAIYEADTFIKKAMWHTHFEWKAMFVLKNERKASSVATVFQNFVLNHSAMMKYGWGKRVQAKYGKILWYAYALMFAWLLFSLYEALLRWLGRKAHNQSSYGWPLGIAIWQLIWFVPYAWIIYWWARYSSINVLTWWKDISNWIDYKDWTRILKWLATIMWVWWTAEFDRIYKGYIKDNKKKSKIPTKSLSRSRTTRRRKRD